GAAGGTALLAVPVGEHRAVLRDTINVRRAITHDAVVVGADIEPANVIAPDDENVGFRGCHRQVSPSLGLFRPQTHEKKFDPSRRPHRTKASAPTERGGDL